MSYNICFFLQPKYITKLVEKAKIRKQEQELLKERQQEDHLYGDKEKFVTAAYKKKLAELEKWNEEERLRQLREEAEEVIYCCTFIDFVLFLIIEGINFQNLFSLNGGVDNLIVQISKGNFLVFLEINFFPS